MIMLDQCQTNRRSEHFEKEYLALGLFQAVLVFYRAQRFVQFTHI